MSDKKRYMLTIVSILILVIGVTFAYLAARVSDGTLSKLNLSADNVDDFKFSVDKDIALTATQFNLTSGGGNLSDETIATASLKANGTKKLQHIIIMYTLLLKVMALHIQLKIRNQK